MPVGAPFESHVEPYNQIRVDDFTNTHYRPAWINLLSHIHSDHTQGLNTPSFSSQVVCSKDSKSMLLLLESVDNRINFDNGVISQRKRTFATLQRGGKNHRDLLLALPLNTPTKLDIGPNETAMVTLLDANHCPGSVMFLIEGKRGAILHTGDVRAEPAMISRLAQNDYIAPYLFTNGQQKKQLEAVYLDTASFIGTQVVPSKASAVQGLLGMIGMYPKDTLFYINIWTWGYEDLLIGIADCFNTKIHVDRHKYLILCSIEHYHSSPSFPKCAKPDVFKNILTCDEHETRFHACERYNQCTTIKPTDPEPKRRTHRNSIVKQVPTKRVVWINPGVVASSNWESYIQGVNDQLKEGQFVDTLKVPLSRHSTLTELQSLVALLRPKNLYPTSNMPSLEGLDWACLPGVFAECLTPDGYEKLRCSTLEVLRKRFPDIDSTPDGMAKRVEQVLLKVGHPDSEQDNAVGADEIEWTEARFQRAIKTKEHIETYLPWLFGHQDAPVSEPMQCGLAENPPEASAALPTSPPTTVLTAPKTKPSKMCSTCANCSTCRPKPSNTSSKKNSSIEVRIGGNPLDPVDPMYTPSLTTGSSKTHIVEPSIVPAQRNEQMYSPPPELSKCRTNLETLSGASAIIVSDGRPKKRLRTGCATSSLRSPSTPPEQPEIMDYSSLNRTQTILNLGASPTPVQFTSSSRLAREIPDSSPNDHTLMDNSQKVFHSSSTSNSRPQTQNIHPTQTIVEPSPYTRLPHNTQHSNDITVISSTLSTTTAKSPVLFSESDTRERRRMSKVKERDIRAQLAKLPPDFSRALAATKSGTKHQ
ncbi:unnamed protein product [Rhizoctonia solani]|uniref:Protein artemis n=1 Tax=Rhizoctonia solani TaxID=456999 RepID=A0A8H3A5H4_9AGAM|nr:unnamed protein product [Rhizoctonia solani]